MHPPRVLHLIGSLHLGGTERQLVETIRRSSEPERHLVACITELGELAGELPVPPVCVGPVGRSLRDLATDVRAFERLRGVLRAFRPDVVHAHLGHAEVLAAAAVPPGVPIVASRRGHTPGFEGALGRAAMGLAHRRERVLVCNSRYLADRARRLDRWVPPIALVPNAVDLDRFSPEAAPDGPPTVAVVANLRAVKGHDRFLRAWRLVLDRLPEARAVLVGDGPERYALERVARALDIADAVTFVGAVDDPRPFVSGAHVVALTSRHEGFPNALLEAMAMGRPVVATAVGGVPELVDEGRNGHLVPAEPPKIAEALVRLLVDRPGRRRMGSAARTTAEGFPWHRTVEAIEAVYAEVTATPNGRAMRGPVMAGTER